jgi:hypothetical protein
MVCLRFQLTKQLNLVAHLSAGMQNLKSRSEFSGRSVISLDGQLRHFAQPNCGKKEQNKPRTATDVSGGSTPKKPGNARNGEDGECGDTPATVR